MFSQFQQTILLLALVVAPRVVDAHGKVRSWTIVHANGSSTVMPGQDYGDMGITAQRRVSQDLVNNDDPNIPEKGTGIIYENAVCNSIELSSGETWPLEPGSTLIPQWTHIDVDGGPIPAGSFWPTGHGGPAMEYMAACPGDNCDGFNPVDGDWFKIGESILYDGKWATEKVYQDGQWPITIPTDLKKGAYILRHELITVHGEPGQPQIYPVCIQIYLGGTGTTVPSKTYKLPAAYTEFDTSFMNYQIQGDDTHGPTERRHFAAPGPPLYNGKQASDAGTGSNSTVAETPTTSAVVAPTPTSLTLTGVSSVVDPLAPAASGVSAQAGVSAVSEQYTTAVSGAPVAGASPIPAAPADPLSSPSAGGPNAYTSSPPVSGAYTTAPTGNIMGDYRNKVVVNPTDGTGSPLEKPLPSSSDGVTAGASSVSPTTVTALAAGVDSSAPSVISNAATSSAATGTSEYASNIQGGRCGANTWRCGKKADGSLFLEVCGNKDGSGALDWVPSNPLCPSKCDDSKPQNPICE